MTDDDVCQAVYGPGLISTADAELHYGIPPFRVWQWRTRGKVQAVYTLAPVGKPPAGLYPLWRLVQLNDAANADLRAKPEPMVLSA